LVTAVLRVGDEGAGCANAKEISDRITVRLLVITGRKSRVMRGIQSLHRAL